MHSHQLSDIICSDTPGITVSIVLDHGVHLGSLVVVSEGTAHAGTGTKSAPLGDIDS